jgi:uncharacterized protein (TIGR03118 family)
VWAAISAWPRAEEDRLERRTVVSVVSSLLLAASSAHAAGTFRQFNLASDIPGLAQAYDPALINPWGVAPGPRNTFWVANNASRTVQLIDAVFGQPRLTFVVPAVGPTGIVANHQPGAFVIRDSVLHRAFSAAVIVAAQDGSLSAWSPFVDTLSAVVVSSDPAASYTGLATGSVGDTTFLYAANFAEGKIEVYDSRFEEAALPDSFFDPTLPLGYTPFNVANINGELYVMYAVTNGQDEVPGPGAGLVNVFDTQGHYLRRFAANGVLNAPWGATIAPASFGAFAGDVLIGNFGDGTIHAFDPTSGAFIGTVLADSSLAFLGDTLGFPRDSLGFRPDSAGVRPLAIPGLWGLAFTDPNAAPRDLGNLGDFIPSFGDHDKQDRLVFAAGIDDETHGLFGVIRPQTRGDDKVMVQPLVRLMGTAVRLSLGETVRFQVVQPELPTDVTIYDLAGREIAAPARGVRNAADVTWNGAASGGAPVAAGVYLYRARAGARASEGKFVVLR